MRRYFAAIGLVLALVATCGGQTIDGPDQVQSSHPAFYAVVDAPGAASVVFFPAPYLVVGGALKPGHAMLWTQTPGDFSVNAIAVDWDARLITPLSKIVEVVGVTPPDPPDPPDPPNPGGQWQVMFFLESDDLDNLPRGQVELLSGRAFREKLESAGHRFMGSYDRSAVMETKQVCQGGVCIRQYQGVRDELRPWWAAVQGDPLPRVALAPIGGGPVIDYPLPADPAAFYQLLETLK